MEDEATLDEHSPVQYESLTKESSLTVWGGVKGEGHSAEALMAIGSKLQTGGHNSKMGLLPLHLPGMKHVNREWDGKHTEKILSD